jgi:hypothetical protein
MTRALDGDLIVGGSFTTMNGIPANRVARWRCRQTVQWNNPAGGNFDDPANWNPSMVPGLYSEAVFDLPGTYVVQRFPSEFSGSLRFADGNVTLASNGASATMLGGVTSTGGMATFTFSLRVGGDVSILETGTLRLSGRVNGRITNAGELHLWGLPVQWNQVPESLGLAVEQSYVQTSTGTLRVEITGTSPREYTSLFLMQEGPSCSSLDGTLAIQSYVPPPGSNDVYTVIRTLSTEVQPPQGRFSRYQGLRLQTGGGDDNRFLAVLERQAACPAIDEEHDFVQVFPVSVPRTIVSDTPITVPSADRKLVLITHGWDASITPNESDPLFRIGMRMSDFGQECFETPVWDVVYLNWNGYNAFADGPQEAALHANAIGISLARWMEERGIRYEGVHAIGHSAGSWLVDALVRSMIDYPQTSTPPGSGAVPSKCQVTVLDAFLPGTLLSALGDPGRLDYACEQYLDSLDVPPLRDTNVQLRNFINYDVRSPADFTHCIPGPDDIGLQSVVCASNHHAYPKVWYGASIPDEDHLPTLLPCAGRLRAPGFERSEMFADYVSDIPSGSGCDEVTREVRGDLYNVASPGQQVMPPTNPVASSGLHPDTVTPGPTGTVSFPSPGWVGMLTGSPVQFSTEQSLTGEALAFQIQVRSITNGSGELIVLDRGRIITGFTESDFQSLPPNPDGSWTTPLVALSQPAGPGDIELTFWLQTLDGSASEIHIGSLRFLGTGACTTDFNGDGDTGTDQDIEAFFACLAGNCCATCGSSDFNNDGDFGTDQDIESFFRVLAGGPC